jgi:hypothetical protein
LARSLPHAPEPDGFSVRFAVLFHVLRKPLIRGGGKNVNALATTQKSVQKFYMQVLDPDHSINASGYKALSTFGSINSDIVSNPPSPSLGKASLHAC